MRTSRLGFIAVAASVVILTACGADGSSGGSSSMAAAPDLSTPTAPLDEVVSISLSTLPTLNWAPLWVAQERGYFEDEKLDVELTQGGTGQDTQSLVASGRLDGAFAGLSAGFFNGVANGLDVKIVGGGGESRPGDPLSAYLAKADGPIKEVADLRGQKVAVPGGLGALSGYYLGRLLEQGGLTPEDVEVVNLSFPDGLAALANDSVAAAVSSAPALTSQLASGEYVVVGDMDEVLELGSGGVIMFGPSLVNEDRRAAVALLRAVRRAAVDLQGDYRNDADLVRILAAGTGLPAAAVEAGPLQTFDVELGFELDLAGAMQKFYREVGLLSYDTDIDVDSLIDHELVRAASAEG